MCSQRFSLTLTNLALTLLAGAVAVWGCTQPELTVYETEGYGSDYVEMARRFDSRVDVPDFSLHGMSNSRLGHCQDGVWLAFPEANYTGFPYIWDQDTCGGWGGSVTGYNSAHIVGDPSNFTVSTLNTFPDYHYQGGQTTHYDASRRLDAGFQSLVLMGSSAVELFTGTGHTGLSICVRPHLGQVSSYSELVKPNEWNRGRGTKIYNLVDVLGLPVGSIQSFAFGCRNGVIVGTIPAHSGSFAHLATARGLLGQRRRQ